MRDRLEFHYHYRHFINKFIITSGEAPTLTHADTPLQTKSARGDVWQHATDYLHPMCENRFGSPLFGLVLQPGPWERWFQHDLIAPNKRQERSGDDRERLGGAERSGAASPERPARVSADVTAVTILEVNKLNLEREDRELGGRLVGGRVTVVWKLWSIIVV